MISAKSGNTPSSMLIPPQDQSTATEAQSTPNNNASIVSLYGIVGSGKIFLLDQLKQESEPEHFAFYEDPKMIDTVVP